MGRKIIVTGGCGYIGSHTVVSLLENDFEVVVIDDLSNSNSFILDGIERITGKKAAFEKMDLKDLENTRSMFNDHNDAVAVMHFAASKAVGESVQKPLIYYQNNLVALINTLIGQTENGIKKLIFSSSATVYGKPDSLPITEQNIVKRPFSVYGNTKKVAEEILEDLASAEPTFSAISLRYFNPIGAHESGLIGELPIGVPNNLMPFITQTAMGIRPLLKVFGDDYDTKDGTPIRDYIHVEDLAEAHVKALKYMMTKEHGKNWEIFNLGTGQGYSVMEIIDSFERITGTKLNYEIVDRREGDVPQLYASSELTEQKLKWKAKKGLEEMIRSSWEWEKKYGKQNN